MVEDSMFSLQGKKALVTGAAGGIGKACALAMARAGADVAVIDLKVEWGMQTVEEIKELGRNSIFVKADLTKVEQVEMMVKRVVSEFGCLDIAFNNAGIIVGSTEPTIGETALENWRRIIDIDLNGVFYCCREEAKYMIPRNSGTIVNTASISGSIVNNFPGFGSGFVAYCAAKAGIKHMTKAFAIEWAKYNIRVNSISPGRVITPMSQNAQEDEILLNHENSITPMKRQATADEMAGGVIYLVSDAASYTTGHDLIMDGGYTVY